MLVIFAVVALIDVYSGNAAAHSIKPQARLVQPVRDELHRPGGRDAAGDLHLLGMGLGRGRQRGVRRRQRGTRAAPPSSRRCCSSLIYLLVSAGAQAYHGTGFISSEENASDVLHALGKGVLGAVGVKFLIVAVLTSASASTQTTILPTARTTLSMAKWGAIPPIIGSIHPRFLTPTVSTWGFGILSVAVAVPLILISETVLELAVVALGIPVCFYYGSTGLRVARLLPARSLRQRAQVRARRPAAVARRA